MKQKVKYILFPPLFQTFLFIIVKLFQCNLHSVNIYFDDKIPFLSFFVIFYVVWYALLILVPVMLYYKDYSKIREYAYVYCICGIISTIIFFIFPTTVTRAIVEETNISNKVVKYIYTLDNPPLNCFPSLHALESMLWIFYVGFNNKFSKKTRFIITIICFGIILSTLFIKQHALVDIIGAFLVLVIGYNISKLLLNNRVKKY